MDLTFFLGVARFATWFLVTATTSKDFSLVVRADFSFHKTSFVVVLTVTPITILVRF